MAQILLNNTSATSIDPPTSSDHAILFVEDGVIKLKFNDNTTTSVGPVVIPPEGITCADLLIVAGADVASEDINSIIVDHTDCSWTIKLNTTVVSTLMQGLLDARISNWTSVSINATNWNSPGSFLQYRIEGGGAIVRLWGELRRTTGSNVSLIVGTIPSPVRPSIATKIIVYGGLGVSDNFPVYLILDNSTGILSASSGSASQNIDYCFINTTYPI